MTNKELKEWILDNLYTCNKKQLAPIRSNKKWFEKRNLLYYYFEIVKHTNFLDDNIPIKERVRYIINGVNKHIICECGKPIKNTSRRDITKNIFCSTKCLASSIKIREKTKKTNIEKYGHACSLNNDKIKAKSNKTIKEKYGVDHTFKAQSVKNKIVKTMKERHGITNPSQRFISKETIGKINNKQWLYDEYIIKNKTCIKIAEEISTTPRTILYHLKKFNIKIKKNRFQSSAEKEIIQILPNNINIIHGDNKAIYPYQIDVYLPDYKLGIEYNGIFYHSYYKEETDKEKEYHLNKTIRAKNKGIKLLHIFENEWINKTKRKIWESIINEYLNIDIIVKNIKIKHISKETIILFLKDNSLKNYEKSNINIALYSDNVIVSIISLSNIDSNNYILNNFCNKNFSFNKNNFKLLMKHFIDNYNPYSILSKLDFRYENEKIYEENSFYFIEKTYPNYSYIKNNKFYDKSFLSSSAEAFSNNYRRIWDCGHLIYEWRKNNGKN